MSSIQAAMASRNDSRLLLSQEFGFALNSSLRFFTHAASSSRVRMAFFGSSVSILNGFIRIDVPQFFVANKHSEEFEDAARLQVAALVTFSTRGKAIKIGTSKLKKTGSRSAQKNAPVIS